MLRRQTVFCGAWLACLLTACSALAADRPVTSKLLPKGTVAYISIADVRLLCERAKHTSVHQFWQEPQMKAILQQTFHDAAPKLGAIQEKMGISLKELASIPSGEITLAITLPEKKGNPAIIVLIDTKDGTTYDKLIELGLDKLRRLNARLIEETVSGTRMTTAESPKDARHHVAWFRRDGALVITNQPDEARAILARWSSATGPVLADNDRFQAMQAQFHKPGSERPQVTWFVNPAEVGAAIARIEPKAQVGLALAPALGLDGVRAIGGSLAVASGTYDGIGQLHVLTEANRRGVLKAVAFRPVDSAPERWLPAGVVGYAKSRWEMGQTVATAREMFDSFRGKGSFQELLDSKVNAKLGLNLEQDLIGAFEGTSAHALLSMQHEGKSVPAGLLGLKLKDPAAFQPTLEKLLGKVDKHITREERAGTKVYRFKLPEHKQRTDKEKTNRPVRHATRHTHGLPRGLHPHAPLEPCFAVVDGHLLFASHLKALELAIQAAARPQNALAESVAYRRVMQKMDGQKPVMVHFHSTAEHARAMHAAASNPDVLTEVEKHVAHCPLLRNFVAALKAHPLPAYDLLQPYFVPGGAMLTDDETGWHLTAFHLAR